MNTPTPEAPTPEARVCGRCGFTAPCACMSDQPNLSDGAYARRYGHAAADVRRGHEGRYREAPEASVEALLQELHTLVRGECPSLLNEDSGGDAALDARILAALQRARETGAKA